MQQVCIDLVGLGNGRYRYRRSRWRLQRSGAWIRERDGAVSAQCPIRLPHTVFGPIFPELYRGSAYDVVLCVLLRAHAVTVLLNSESADPERDRLKDYLIVNALWDTQGNLDIAQHLLDKREVRHG